MHYDIRRRSNQTVMDSQGAAEWTICFLPQHQRQIQRLFQFAAIVTMIG